MNALFPFLVVLAVAGCSLTTPPPRSASSAPAPTVIIGAGEDTPSVTRIPAPGGEVVLATAKDRALMYEQYSYAGARRAGDFVFLSGVVAGPLAGEARDAEGFKQQLRRAFSTIRRNLEAAGATMADVVELDTFHVLDSPHFQGDANAHINAVLEVKQEFLAQPYSTWTVIGVSALADPTAIVEIKATAYAPDRKAKR